MEDGVNVSMCRLIGLDNTPIVCGKVDIYKFRKDFYIFAESHHLESFFNASIFLLLD